MATTDLYDYTLTILFFLVVAVLTESLFDLCAQASSTHTFATELLRQENFYPFYSIHKIAGTTIDLFNAIFDNQLTCTFYATRL